MPTKFAPARKGNWRERERFGEKSHRCLVLLKRVKVKTSNAERPRTKEGERSPHHHRRPREGTETAKSSLQSPSANRTSKLVNPGRLVKTTEKPKRRGSLATKNKEGRIDISPTRKTSGRQRSAQTLEKLAVIIRTALLATKGEKKGQGG